MDDTRFADCLHAARQRDESAIIALYDRFAARVHAYLYYRMGDADEADDLTEEVFLHMLKAIGSCRAQTEGSFAAWLFRIAHNLEVNWLKKRLRRPMQALDEELIDPAAGPDGQAEQRLGYERLQQAVRGLTDEQREVVLMRFVGGMSSAQVAQALGVSEGAVKALQHRALAGLRRALGDGKGVRNGN